MRRALLLGSLLVGSVVHAQTITPTAPQKPTKPMIDAAERHFHDGVKFTEEGNYEAARVCFESGYKLSGEPDFLHNLSWTAERQGQLADAITYAQRYLEAKPNADNAERTRRRIELLRARLGQSDPAQPAPDAKPAAQASSEPAKNATSAPTSPAKPSQSWKMPPGAIGLLAGGGALTLAGVGLLAGAWATGQQAQQGLTFDDWTAVSDRGRALNAGGISLAIVGGVAVVGGGIWAIVGRKPKIEQPEIAE
jgi:tetratricopeptide (TPR) repeat protein